MTPPDTTHCWRTLRVLLSLLLFYLLGTGVRAQSVQLWFPDTLITEIGPFRLPLYASTNGANVRSYQLAFRFDASVMRIDSIVRGPGQTGGFLGLGWNEVTPGQIILTDNGPQGGFPARDSSVFLWFHFTATDKPTGVSLIEVDPIRRPLVSLLPGGTVTPTFTPGSVRFGTFPGLLQMDRYYSLARADSTDITLRLRATQMDSLLGFRARIQYPHDRLRLLRTRVLPNALGLADAGVTHVPTGRLSLAVDSAGQVPQDGEDDYDLLELTFRHPAGRLFAPVEFAQSSYFGSVERSDSLRDVQGAARSGGIFAGPSDTAYFRVQLPRRVEEGEPLGVVLTARRAVTLSQGSFFHLASLGGPDSVRFHPRLTATELDRGQGVWAREFATIDPAENLLLRRGDTLFTAYYTAPPLPFSFRTNYYNASLMRGVSGVATREPVVVRFFQRDTVYGVLPVKLDARQTEDREIDGRDHACLLVAVTDSARVNSLGITYEYDTTLLAYDPAPGTLITYVGFSPPNRYSVDDLFPGAGFHLEYTDFVVPADPCGGLPLSPGALYEVCWPALRDTFTTRIFVGPDLLGAGRQLAARVTGCTDTGPQTFDLTVDVPAAVDIRFPFRRSSATVHPRELGVTAVPNPTAGEVVLRGLRPTDKLSVWLADGRRVAVPATGRMLDFGGLPAGVYFVRVLRGERSGTLRILLR